MIFLSKHFQQGHKCTSSIDFWLQTTFQAAFKSQSWQSFTKARGEGKLGHFYAWRKHQIQVTAFWLCGSCRASFPYLPQAAHSVITTYQHFLLQSSHNTVWHSFLVTCLPVPLQLPWRRWGPQFRAGVGPMGFIEQTVERDTKPAPLAPVFPVANKCSVASEGEVLAFPVCCPHP